MITEIPNLPPEETSFKLPDIGSFYSETAKLISSFDTSVGKTITINRNKRSLRIDIDKEREKGRLDKDETFIAMRIIAQNIKREIVPYVNYLIQSPRACVFTDIEDSLSPTARIENEYTTVTRYPGYFDAFYATLDGGIAHGSAVMEIVYDETKPGYVRFSSVPAEDFIYPLNLRELQSAPRLVRRYHFSRIELEDYSKLSGFDKSVADEVLKDYKNCNDDKDYEVWKVFTKLDGIVYVAWILEGNSSKYFRPLIPFVSGVFEQVTTLVPEVTLDPMTGVPTIVETPKIEWKPASETEYPFKQWVYARTEDQLVINSMGRCESDTGLQEAQCSLWSTYVNSCNRSGNVYAALGAKADPGTKPEAIDFVIESGRLINQPVTFTSHPSPPLAMIDAAQRLNVTSSEAMGQISFATNNRVDSRKTAEEIRSASTQNAGLDSVAVVDYSSFIQSIHTYSWRIVRSAALRSAIPFLATDGINDIETISKNYIIKPAGDSDVIQKEQRLNNRLKVWPIVSTIPNLANTFLLDILSEMFPTEAKKYEQILLQAQSDNKFKDISGALIQMIEGFLELPALAQDTNVQSQRPKIEQIKQALSQ